MLASSGLRPTTQTVLHALGTLGDDAIGQTFADLAVALGVAERTIRRALRELEAAALVRCARTADRRKYVAELALPDHDAARIRFQNGPKRPKTAQPQASLHSHTIKGAVVVSLHGGPAPTAPAPPPPQQLLGLEGTTTEDERIGARRALGSLDQVVRLVWERRSVHHGFISSTTETLEGLTTAMRRYPWEHIVACVRWSAERCADGRLDPRMLATTFRGGAFDSRHADWQKHLRSAALQAVSAAEHPEPARAPATAQEQAAVLAGAQWWGGRA